MHRWEARNEKGSGGILCLDNYDVIGDGILDLIVGRDDGLVEIYGYDEMDEPMLRHSQVRQQDRRTKGVVGEGRGCGLFGPSFPSSQFFSRFTSNQKLR